MPKLKKLYKVMLWRSDSGGDHQNSSSFNLLAVDAKAALAKALRAENGPGEYVAEITVINTVDFDI
jgi:hypothetical protein